MECNPISRPYVSFMVLSELLSVCVKFLPGCFAFQSRPFALRETQECSDTRNLP